MQLRKKFLAFAVFAAIAATILWILPQPQWRISSEGTHTENRYWWWIAGGALVIGGCFVEYLFFETLDHLDKRITSRQKAFVQIGLLLAIGLALGVTAFQLWG